MKVPGSQKHSKLGRLQSNSGSKRNLRMSADVQKDMAVVPYENVGNER